MILYYITGEVTQPQRTELKEKGYFVYDMRTADDGKGYTIEPCVLANHEGVMITNKQLPLHEVTFTNGHKHAWLNDDEFMALGVQEMDWEEIKDIFSRNNNTNFHFHIKGKTVDEYWMWRTYDLAIAKAKLKKRLEILKAKDPFVRAYQFGRSKDKKAFWKIYYSIEKNKISN